MGSRLAYSVHRLGFCKTSGVCNIQIGPTVREMDGALIHKRRLFAGNSRPFVNLDFTTSRESLCLEFRQDIWHQRPLSHKLSVSGSIRVTGQSQSQSLLGRMKPRRRHARHSSKAPICKLREPANVRPRMYISGMLMCGSTNAHVVVFCFFILLQGNCCVSLSQRRNSERVFTSHSLIH